MHPLTSTLPLPLLAGTAVFLSLAVAYDVRARRIPHWLLLPAFAAAVAYGAWAHGLDGALHALLGAGTAVALLALPYVTRVIGAGDVKAAMVLGAALGAASVAALSLVALCLAGAFALVRMRFAARAEPSGIPLMIGIALVLGAQQLLTLAPS